MSITTPEPTVRPLPRKLRFRGYPLNLNAQGGKAALPPRFCPSDKTLVRALRRRPIVVAKSAELRFRLTAKTAPAPLLLLSQSGPLRWARFGSPSWGPEGGCTIPWQKEIPAFWRGFLKGVNYSSMSITTPEPTVRPLPRKLRFRGYPLNLNAQGGKAALPPRFCPSDKTLVRALRRRPIVVAKSAELRFRLTAKTAPAPLLLLSQSGPLRWARFGSPSWGPEGGRTIPWQKEIPAIRWVLVRQ